MEITINLSEDLTNRLFSILSARRTGQTAEELASELLEDSIFMAYIKDVDGHKS